MIRKAGLLSVLVVVALAPSFADPGDPPGRVARLNYESGSVSFRPGSVEEWSPANLNYPLTNGDYLWADRDSRAEMHIGSTAVRLGSETALSFLNLDDRTVQLSLTSGVIHVRLRSLDPDETFEVDTPNVAISLLRPGDYRIQADGDNAVTVLSVFGGEAELTSGGGSFAVHPRQAARVTGTDSVTSELIELPYSDDFDRWCEDRDRREDRAQSVRYVPREMTGYEDLDQYGVWSEAPSYGWVWTPTAVAVGWAPYRYGHWVWVAPWGWTWVDDAPWGFAPFHYGRWAFVGATWVWVPGRIVARPMYAPALVAFVGGPRFNVSVAIGGGGGGVAWFPLGPGELYRPAYHVSDTYVRNVNVTHVNVTNINVTNVNVTNVRYVNQNVRGAVTAVPQQTFVSARPVGQAATVVSQRDAMQAQVVGTTAAVAPRPQSIAVRPAAAVVHPPAAVLQHRVVTRAAPPPPPVPFRAQQQALQNNPGRPLDAGTLSNIRQSQPAPPPQVRTTPAPGRQPFGEPAPRPQTFGAPRNDRPASAPPGNPPFNRQPAPPQPQVQEQPRRNPDFNRQPPPPQPQVQEQPRRNPEFNRQPVPPQAPAQAQPQRNPPSNQSGPAQREKEQPRRDERRDNRERRDQ